jgi:AcrR family transcriptional regulator
MNDSLPSSHTGQRGPADHVIRAQIVKAANEHFSHYGYRKTTVSDLANAIGFSKAYIYKFFESKQAIGEAICTECLGSIVDDVLAAILVGPSATDRYRKLFKTMVNSSMKLFTSERKLYDIAAISTEERWQSSVNYDTQIREILWQILVEGRETGEFERKTPLDETCRAILLVMQPFVDPLMLQHNLDRVDEGPGEITGLVLRSLSP